MGQLGQMLMKWMKIGRKTSKNVKNEQSQVENGWNAGWWEAKNG